MSGHETARERALRLERVTPDHFPTCPNCGELCGRLAVICADCHAPLKPTESDLKLAAANGRLHGMPHGNGNQIHPTDDDEG